MAGRITLNSLYKAINMALDIQTKQQLQIFQTAGSKINGSMVNGFWRPEDDNRYRHVTPTLLREYCTTLTSQPDLLTSGSQQDLLKSKLQEVVETLSKGERVDLKAMIEFWQGITPNEK